MAENRFFEYVTRLLNNERRNRAGWAAELYVSERTITNFNTRLEKEYGIIIDYYPGAYGYYEINKDQSTNFNDFVNFIHNLKSSDLIADAFINSDAISKHLIFHQNWNQISWMQFFNPLLTAINDQRFVSIQFFNYRTEKQEEYNYFRPYWMKQNAYYRWYVIGFTSEESDFPTVLGFDKIRNFRLEDQKFERKPELEHFRKDYERIFGVYTYPDRAPETVRIECTRFQAAYLESLPLHSSQKRECYDGQTVIFSYSLVVNHEFAYELARQNVWNFNPNMLDFPHPQRTAIKVLEPKWLADYFYQTYKRAFLAYCDNPDIEQVLWKEVRDTPFPYPLPEF